MILREGWSLCLSPPLVRGRLRGLASVDGEWRQPNPQGHAKNPHIS